MRYTITPLNLSFNPDYAPSHQNPALNKSLGPQYCGRNARNPECPRSSTHSRQPGNARRCFLLHPITISSLRIDSLNSPVSTAISCSLSWSTPPPVSWAFIGAIIISRGRLSPYQESSSQKRRKSLERRIWFVPNTQRGSNFIPWTMIEIVTDKNPPHTELSHASFSNLYHSHYWERWHKANI